METFIYYCENANGAEMSFLSKAVLDTGMIVYDDAGNPFTIVDMAIKTAISVYEDAMDRAFTGLNY